MSEKNYNISCTECNLPSPIALEHSEQHRMKQFKVLPPKRKKMVTTPLTEFRKTKWRQISRLISTLGEKPQGTARFLRHVHLHFVTWF